MSASATYGGGGGGQSNLVVNGGGAGAGKFASAESLHLGSITIHNDVGGGGGGGGGGGVHEEPHQQEQHQHQVRLAEERSIFGISILRSHPLSSLRCNEKGALRTTCIQYIV